MFNKTIEKGDIFMKNTQKTIMLVLSLLTPIATMPCVFTVTNDSSYKTVYLVTNPDLAESVQQATLDKIQSVDIVKVDNAGLNNTKKTKHNMWFFVYTPNKQKGTYDRTYKLSINYCSMEPGANELTISQIEKGIIQADEKCDRYIVTNFKNNTQKEECGNITKKAARNATPPKCHTQAPTQKTHEMKEEQVIERDYPGQFLSNEETFPGTLP